MAHSQIKAAAFTGSRKGGMALGEIARARRVPIPFYAEMSGVNPVFVLPHAMAQKGDEIVAGLQASVTGSAGQLCTKPGILVVEEGRAGDLLVIALGRRIGGTKPVPMLNAAILENYRLLIEARAHDERVRRVEQAAAGASGGAALFETDAETYLANPDLAAEVFGPAALVVRYRSIEQALEIAAMEGNLTGTIHTASGDEEDGARLAVALEAHAGRILFGGYPTGVEVCQAMVHGGPFPAPADGRTTSVGGRAIERFARPVCFQDFPAALLPEELRPGNPAGVWRMVNGERTMFE
jgi:NADP-dependent aldehyde dehydrogenase